jgi:hypothetical protein
MTHAAPEPRTFLGGLVLDGELISLGDDGLPSLPRLSERALHGYAGIGVFGEASCQRNGIAEPLLATFADRSPFR